MLYPDLRNPRPEIARIRKSRFGDGRERRRRERRKKWRVLASDHRRMRPVQTEGPSAQPHQAKSHPIGRIWKSARKIEAHVATRARPSEFGAEHLQSDLRLPKTETRAVRASEGIRAIHQPRQIGIVDATTIGEEIDQCQTR